MGLNILDARITPLDGGLSLDTYLVLEDNGHADRGPPPRARDRAAAVASPAEPTTPSGRWSRGARRGRCACSRRRRRSRSPRTRCGSGHDPRADRRRPARAAVGDRQGAARRARGRRDRTHHDHRRARRGRLLHHRRAAAGNCPRRRASGSRSSCTRRSTCGTPRRSPEHGRMNPRLGSLRPYPFERLRALLGRRHAARGPAAHPAVDRRAEARPAALHRRGPDRGAVVARQLPARARTA